MSILLFALLGSFAVLLVAIKWRADQDNGGTSARPELWQVMAQDLTLDDMRRQQGKVGKWLLLAAFCAWGLSCFFLVKYMTGGTMNPMEWDLEQWLNAGFALLLTAIITAFQYFLYSINQKGPAAFIGVVVCVFFGLFSEISNSMEREGATVRARSEESSVFQATVNAIGTTSNAATVTTSPALIEAEQAKAKALVEIEACERHRPRGQARVDKCLRIEQGNLAAAQATISAIKSGNNEAVAANHNQALALVDKAKSLSFDEAQHFEIIKLMKDWLGIAAIAASFLFSFIIMGTFEYAFHYLAVYFGALKKAIKALSAHEEQTAQAPETAEPKQPRAGWDVSPAVGVGVGAPIGDSGLGIGAGVVATPRQAAQAKAPEAPPVPAAPVQPEKVPFGFAPPKAAAVETTAELPARATPGRTGKYSPLLGRSEQHYSLPLGEPVQELKSPTLPAETTDDLYLEWFNAVSAGTCKHSQRETRQFIQKRVSADQSTKKTPPPKEIGQLAKIFIKRAAHAGLLVKNEKYTGPTSGFAEYLKA